MSHTGGDWFLDKNHSGRIMGVASTTRRHDLEFVCLVENEPDARLIAAAPELLEAATVVWEWWIKFGDVPALEFEKLQKAIAKAQG